MEIELLSDYVHQALRSERSEIRLLDILPATDTSEPLRGVLHHGRLRYRPYDALSYVWGTQSVGASYMELANGDDRPTGSILTFRHRKNKTPARYRKKIGSNLSSALKQLRQKDRIVTVWVDALCIDQYNNHEKSQQVQLMTQIYSAATTVHAWLGPQTHELRGTQTMIQDAFALINVLAGIIRHCQNAHVVDNETTWLDACRMLAIPANPDMSNRENEVAVFCVEFRSNVSRRFSEQASWHRFLRALQALSKVEYFSRIWILQECIRARDQTFHYGELIAPRNLLFLALCLASEAPAAISSDEAGFSLVRFDMRFFDCITVRNAKNLKDILELTYFSGANVREASKAQDLIYGLVGLSKQSEIEVDYDLTTEAVYTQTAEQALSQGFLDLIVTFKPYNAVAGMPSWVYDWRTRGSQFFANFKACGNNTGQVSFRRNATTRLPFAMRIAGFEVGGVTATGFHFSAIATQAGFSRDAIGTGLWRDHLVPTTAAAGTELRRLISGIHRLHQCPISESDLTLLFGDVEFPAASFWFWWIQWTTKLWKFVSQHVGENHQAEVHSLISELLTRGESKFVAIANDIASLLNIHRWTEPDPAGLKALEPLYRNAWGMRPIALDTGFIGLATESVESGDRVVILHGVKAPLIIRESSHGNSRIVGPAYMCGTMHGELSKTQRASYTYTLV